MSLHWHYLLLDQGPITEILTKHDNTVNYSSKKRVDNLKHQDIIIGEMGINQTHLFRTNLFDAWWGQKFAYKI